MTVSLRPVALSLAAALSLVGSVPARAASTSTTPARSTPSSTREIARVDGAPGNYVAWVEDAEGEVNVLIAATFPSRPLVAGEFLKRRTPAEVFLALASPRSQLPAALARSAPEALHANERQLRVELREENEAALARLPVDDLVGSSASLAAGCSASFYTWAGSVFGDPTCGQPGLATIDTTYPSDTYCTSGCDYTLGYYDKGQCQNPSLASCDIVKGTATVIRLRTTTNGNPGLSRAGHYAHFGVANCSGNGPVTFTYQRNGVESSHPVGVNQMLHIPLGNSIVPGNAQSFVAYGAWTKSKPASGETYVSNSMSVGGNTGVDDRVIACGDIYTRYDMTDISSPTCHGPNIKLCTGGAGSTCNSACFNCAGGTCN
jgi:hypothetical protein